MTCTLLEGDLVSLVLTRETDFTGPKNRGRQVRRDLIYVPEQGRLQLTAVGIDFSACSLTADHFDAVIHGDRLAVG